MTYYKIRLKDKPDLFLGKRNPSYGICPIEHMQEVAKTQANQTSYAKPPTIAESLEWYAKLNERYFTKEKFAKVWTSIPVLRRFLSYCSRSEGTNTFPQYELVIEEAGKITAVPLDTVLK